MLVMIWRILDAILRHPVVSGIIGAVIAGLILAYFSGDGNLEKPNGEVNWRQKTVKKWLQEQLENNR